MGGAIHKDPQVALTDGSAEVKDQVVEHDGLDFYDAVIDIEKFVDVYDRVKGWSLRCQSSDLGRVVDGVCVSMWGQFKSGKTWLLGRLCEMDTSVLTGIQTKGISIKVSKVARRNVVFLDNVGDNTPLASLPVGVPSGSASRTQVLEALEELHVKEDFCRQLSFSVARVIIYVVRQMSRKDQTALLQLVHTMRQEVESKDLVVVHNLQDLSLKQLKQQDYMDQNRAFFDLADVSLKVEWQGETALVVRHVGHVRNLKVTHYYLTNDKTAGSLNNFVIENMRTIITMTQPRPASGSSPQCLRSLAQELAATATKIQCNFVNFNEKSTTTEIMFEPKKCRFVVAEGCTPCEPVVKSPVVGSYFAMCDNNAVAYNVTTVPCEVMLDEGDTRTCQAHILQIELPGLSDTALSDIKKDIESRKTLWTASREEGSPTEVMVHLDTTLLNAPENLVKVVSESLMRCNKSIKKVNLNPDNSRFSIVKEKRPVNETIFTGIHDYAAEWKPVVEYETGILSVTWLSYAS